jgi:hypothetical protein
MLADSFRATRDPSSALFLKLMYQSTWADFSGVSGTRQFNQIMVQIGGKSHWP